MSSNPPNKIQGDLTEVRGSLICEFIVSCKWTYLFSQTHPMKLRPRIAFYNILQPDKLEAESHRYRINWYPQLSGDRFRHHGRENDLEGSHLPYGNIYRMQCMERELAIRQSSSSGTKQWLGSLGYAIPK